MDSPFKRGGITIKEALDILFEDEDENFSNPSIFIEPPDNDDATDEDSADEDAGGMADNLSRRQLSAGAEIRYGNKQIIGGVEDDFVDSSSTEVSTSQSLSTSIMTPAPLISVTSQNPPLQTRSSRFTRSVPSQSTSLQKISPSLVTQPKLSKFNYTKKCGSLELEPHITIPPASYSNYESLSPVQLFELFFSDDLLTHTIQQISLYAQFKNCADPNVTIEELKVYLGILIVSGYCVLPSVRCYWEEKEDVRNTLVYESMRRDRFYEIQRFLHFADNTTIDKLDKMYKLRPLMDILKSKFGQHFIPEQNLSYDESMIKYFGRHGCKQFIRGKPLRFGYKVWCLNTSSGYLINFEVYQGRNPRANAMYEELCGKATAPLLQMIEEFECNQRKPYTFHVDNLFTSINLLYTLKQNGFNATGTIRENRLPLGCPLLSKDEIKKKPRGTYDSVLEKDTGVVFTRWVDNNVVTAASTCAAISPIRKVERFSRALKKNVTVTQPNIFFMYNKSMGGTDLMDQNISTYRVGIRGKKWWFPIFTYLVDAAIQNAWILCRKSGRNLPQIDFRRNIALTYLSQYRSLPKSLGRPGSAPLSQYRVTDDVRLDGMFHWPKTIPDQKRRRCANRSCNKHPRTECKKCKVGLCTDCFESFHTN